MWHQSSPSVIDTLLFHEEKKGYVMPHPFLPHNNGSGGGKMYVGTYNIPTEKTGFHPWIFFNDTYLSRYGNTNSERYALM